MPFRNTIASMLSARKCCPGWLVLLATTAVGNRAGMSSEISKLPVNLSCHLQCSLSKEFTNYSRYECR